MENTIGPDLWPYNRNTNIIDIETAAAIRQWALNDAGISEAELRGLSQRQALRAYIDRGMKPAIEAVLRQRGETANTANGGQRLG